MASNKKIAEMIMAIKTIYPYYSKDNNSEVLARTWGVLLKNYPDEVVEVAFFKCLQSCKMPPTPADVIEQINSMVETTEQSDEELWSIYAKTLREVDHLMYYFQFNFVRENGKSQGDEAREKVQAIWDGLPERLKQYIGSKGELMRMAQSYDDEELKYEKTRFFKSLPTIKKRQEYTDLKALLSNERLLLGE